MIYPNGSESVYSTGLWAQLIKVKNCPCSDGVRRTVHRIRTPDTFWTAPGHVYVKGKTVTGFTSMDNHDGYTFHANIFGRNGHLLP